MRFGANEAKAAFADNPNPSRNRGLTPTRAAASRLLPGEGELLFVLIHCGLIQNFTPLLSGP